MIAASSFAPGNGQGLLSAATDPIGGMRQIARDSTPPMTERTSESNLRLKLCAQSCIYRMVRRDEVECPCVCKQRHAFLCFGPHSHLQDPCSCIGTVQCA